MNFKPLFGAEQRIFLGVDPDSHGHSIKNRGTTFDDIDMPQRQRVKTAYIDSMMGIQRSRHHQAPAGRSSTSRISSCAVIEPN